MVKFTGSRRLLAAVVFVFKLLVVLGLTTLLLQLSPCALPSLPGDGMSVTLRDGAHFAGVSTGIRSDWPDDRSESHPFCSKILSSPLRATAFCKRHANQTCQDGPQQGELPMFSQFGQDYYLFTQHFRNLNRRGVYAEVATRHPVTGSNTYFMDACLGWKGICVEANPETFTWIHRLRSCELVPTCVGKTDGERVRFLLHGNAGGVDDTNKNKAEWTDESHSMHLTCMSMAVAMKRRAITTMDYLSLDVEGHELEVLKGVDWENTIVNVMTIETTDESLKTIEPYLKEKGYVRHHAQLDEASKRTGLLNHDAVFLHKSVVWGKPV